MLFRVVRANSRAGNSYFGILVDKDGRPILQDISKKPVEGDVRVKSCISALHNISYFSYPEGRGVRDYKIMSVEEMFTHSLSQIRDLGLWIKPLFC